MCLFYTLAGATDTIRFGGILREWSAGEAAWLHGLGQGPRHLRRAEPAAKDHNSAEPQPNRTSPGAHDIANRQGNSHGGNATRRRSPGGKVTPNQAIRTAGEHESLVKPVNMPHPHGANDDTKEAPATGNETASRHREERAEGDPHTTSSTPEPPEHPRVHTTVPELSDDGRDADRPAENATGEGENGTRGRPANATARAPAIQPTAAPAVHPVNGGHTKKLGIRQTSLEKLWHHLFHRNKYIQSEPPVPHMGGPLRVGVGINFVKIQDIDESGGTMNMALNLRLYWDDARLDFCARDFFNMSQSHRWEQIPLNSDLIWTPDITIMNHLGQAKLLDPGVTPVILADEEFRHKFSVNVIWRRPIEARSTCDVDMTQFPFDEQNCRIRVASWASSKSWVELVPQQFFETKTIQHGEFNVREISVNKSVVGGAGADRSFDEVAYNVILERQSHYYVINFILPMLALTLLTVGTMFMSISGNAMGQRINGGAKFLLCVVSIIFLTAHYRPAISGDVWMDSFQAHCLASSMSSVLESLIIDFWSKAGWFEWVPKASETDAALRALIVWVTTITIFMDAYEVKRYNALQLYTSFLSSTTVLLVGFVYTMLIGLVLCSTASFLWVLWSRATRPATPAKDAAKTDERARPLLFDEKLYERRVSVCSSASDRRPASKDLELAAKSVRARGDSLSSTVPPPARFLSSGD